MEKKYYFNVKLGITCFKNLTLFFLSFFTIFNSCNYSTSKAEPISQKTSIQQTREIISKENNTIESRFVVSVAYERTKPEASSFQSYLRTLKLKPEGALVQYYDGTQKNKKDVYAAVIDLKIGQKDLHQCADAIMRLRGEYLWQKGDYSDIHFNFTNGFTVAYEEWMKGRRMVVKGNKTYWNNRNRASNTYQDFWNYMELIFMYAGTASLEKELATIPIEDADIGDVLIEGGHPGHAVIIVDKAKHRQTGKAIYLLAQSYMPAQETQILINPTNKSLSPWYELEQGQINTPEWTFDSQQLKRFIL